MTDVRYEGVLYEVADRIATITINRPGKRNTINEKTTDELIAAIDAADRDDDVRVIVVRGEGQMFSAGADLSMGDETFDFESQTGGADSPVRSDGSIDYSNPRVRDGGGRLTLRIYQCVKPIIAAIHGAAVGIGVTMTLAMDARFAATGTKFGLVFARRGIVPEAASTWFLQRCVGLDKALDWCMTGRIFLADEALASGLVRSLHAPEDLLPAVYAYAREIADNTSAISIALTRQMLWRHATAPHPMAAHRIDSRSMYTLGRSDEVKEGIASFLEKRKPRFPGRPSKDMPPFFPWWDEPGWS